jgi:hypothetical protein
VLAHPLRVWSNGLLKPSTTDQVSAPLHSCISAFPATALRRSPRERVGLLRPPQWVGSPARPIFGPACDSAAAIRRIIRRTVCACHFAPLGVGMPRAVSCAAICRADKPAQCPHRFCCAPPRWSNSCWLCQLLLSFSDAGPMKVSPRARGPASEKLQGTKPRVVEGAAPHATLWGFAHRERIPGGADCRRDVTVGPKIGHEVLPLGSSGCAEQW